MMINELDRVEILTLQDNYIDMTAMDNSTMIHCFKPMCNPIAQVFLFNEGKTEFNAIVGLYVGHESLFLKYAQARCAVFAVMDRLLGHIRWLPSVQSTAFTGRSKFR
jgi:uncharacterized metal-binding protein